MSRRSNTVAPDGAGELSAHLVQRINPWFYAHGRDLPWREPGFTVWGSVVSEFMLQQTPVARVVPRLAEWLERWPTPAALAAEPVGEAVRAWGNLGYPRRALRLHACAVAITEQHGGSVPTDVDSLLALPGVGDYTARAIAVFALGQRHPVVDTNIRRVIARAVDGQAQPGPPRARHDLAAMAALLPSDVADSCTFNAGMMELGAIVCTSRSPACGRCPLADLCAWRAADYPDYDGPTRPVQKRYEGSDRQARGAVLRAARQAHNTAIPVTTDAVARLVPDSAQRQRALEGLLADGLLVEADGGYELPG